MTNVHTFGIRAFGGVANFDYDLELAYQVGEADAVGARFLPLGLIYGDDDADYDSWAADLVVGYTFDMNWSPRVYVQGIYYEGEDERDLSFWDWINPFYQGDASVSFDRLFSPTNNIPVLCDNGCMSNFYQISAGVEVKPTEKLFVHAHVGREWVVEPFDSPVSIDVLDWKIPVAPALSFWTQENSDDLGWDTVLMAKYDITEDLWCLIYWNHMFVDDGMTEGAYVHSNGLTFSGGTDDDDIDYVEVRMGIRF